jgi:ribose transport system ATP-binding protein
MATPRLEARHASKTYGATRVLDDAALVVQPGEIHALVGQNGCGKSTLVKILTGYHAPDPGMELAVDGEALSLPVQWRAAQAAGVSVVHQDMGLIDHLSVSENIGIGGFKRTALTRRIDWAAQDAVARSILERLGLDVDPRQPVGDLPASHRAGVAIARALRDAVPGQGLVILDEATRALPREELARSHDVLRRIVAPGTSVLMVSHNLEEVLALADHVTVLRDGRVVGEGLPTAGLTESDLARLMLGATVDAVARTTSARPGVGAAARISGVRLAGHAPLDLTLAQGEVVGITGLPGTGFEELPHLLGGSRRGAGTIVTPRGTVDLARTTVTQCLEAGIALVPERRITDGLAIEMSVRDNLALPTIRRRGRPWLVRRDWQERLAAGAIHRWGIRSPGPGALVRELSGGNQQKVLFAKWLSVEPSLLVLHEPTQAVDVGARADLLRTIGETAAAGAGVLLVSTEPSDLVETCDRVLVLHPGRPPHELRTSDPDDVLEAIYGVPATPSSSLENETGALHV